MEEIFQQLKENGGAVVSTKDCSEMEIAYARTTGKMWVDKDGCGFILRTQSWLDLQKEREKDMNILKSAAKEVLPTLCNALEYHERDAEFSAYLKLRKLVNA